MTVSIYQFSANKTFTEVNEASEFYQEFHNLGLTMVNKTTIDGVSIYYLSKATTAEDALAICNTLGVGIYGRKRFKERNGKMDFN
jgi:hypothetical protein